MIGKEENILVLIQLVGGNDGLNTLVPLQSYEELILHRKNILISENKLIKANTKIGFHPATQSLHNLFTDGEMCVVNNIGYPIPNRSHFRSMDIWNSGSPSNQQWNTGWLGRFLDLYHSRFPDSYPNKLFPDPLAITIGNIVSDTCQGKSFNYSHVVNNLSSFIEINKCSIGAISNKEYSQSLDFLNSTITLTNLYTKQIQQAANKGKSKINYPDKNTLAQELKIVSQLISGGLNTKIYSLSLGGFDTHAYQVGKTDTSEGMHAYLLKTLSEAIDSFVKDLKAQKLYGKVYVMTYSEFGRQIKSNSALGSDHGDANSIYLFGGNFNNQLVGEMPTINKEIDNQNGLDMKIDFRDIYASLLNQLFKLSKSEMNKLFEKDIKEYNIFNIN